MARSLLRSTGLCSVNTFISRIFGFVRDMVLAYCFGADGTFDAFVVAFQIPNFLRRLFAEGAFSQAFVPVLSEYKSTRDHDEVRHFIDHTSGNLALVLVVVVILGVLLAPLLVHIFALGFHGEGQRFSLASGMLRITFPYIFLISLTALCGAILNSYDSFGVPSLTPVLLNVSLIVMAVFFARYFSTPIYAVAWGVCIAGILQFLFQVPFLKRMHLLPRFYVNFRDPGVRKVLRLMFPAILGVSIVQLGLLLDTIFASFLKAGSISWLYYSGRVMNFPLGVFGVAIATVILPKLARQHAVSNITEYSKTLNWALRLLLLIGIPSTLGLALLSGPILSALFQGGVFDQTAVLMSRRSLIAFAIGIQSFMLVKTLASAFYACQDIRTPVRIAMCALALNVLLNFALIIPLAHAGLALSTTLSSMLNAGLLLCILLRRGVFHPQPGWPKYALQILFASVMMSVFLIFASGRMTEWFIHGKFWRIMHLGALCLIGGLVYCLCLWMSGLRVAHFREGYGYEA